MPGLSHGAMPRAIVARSLANCSGHAHQNLRVKSLESRPGNRAYRVRIIYACRAGSIIVW